MAALACPSPELLFQYHGGDPGLASDATFSGHVSSCDTCRSTLAELSAVDAFLGGFKAALPGAAEDLLAAGTLPESIGGHRILRELGHGGMGVVYLAQQEQPHREIALKLIHPAGLSARAARRFALEIEVLGRLEHPAIARIYGAGALVSGHREQPYFTMEYVPGLRLDAWVAQEALPLERRLALFLAVCEGVQHAHLRGVIHRDLKPSNILVDGTGAPKIIDFGLARLAEPDAGSASRHSEAGHILGTLPYLPPESVTGPAADLDVRADVYSLGAVLYELVTGCVPLDLSRDGFPAALQRIATEVPPAPSRVRRDAPRALDGCVLTALEKDPERRYASVRELADDVRRFLEHRPLRARPPGAIHKLSLFARRHRVALGATAAIALVTGAAFVVARYGLDQAVVAEARAEVADAKAERADTTTDAALGFFLGLFRQADPSVHLGAPPSIEEILASGALTSQAALGNEPLVRATALHAIGTLDRSLGHWERAVPVLRTAWELRREALGEDDPATLEAAHDLALALRDDGQPEAAETILRRGYELRVARPGPDEAGAVQIAAELGATLLELGRATEAQALLIEVSGRQAALLGPDHPATLGTLHDLARSQTALSRLEEAIPLLEDVIARCRRVHPPHHPALLAALSSLATAYTLSSRYEEAIALHEEVLGSQRAVLGGDHPHTLEHLTDFSKALISMGRYARSLELAEEALAGLRRTRPEGVLEAESWVAFCRQFVGDAARAESESRRLIPELEASAGVDAPQTVRARFDLGLLLFNAGRYAEAEELLVPARDRLEAIHGEGSDTTIQATAIVGLLQLELGRITEAERLISRAMAVALRDLGSTSAVLLDTRTHLARVYLAQGRLGEAQGLLELNVAEHARLFGVEVYSATDALYYLAQALDAGGRPEEALPLFADVLGRNRVTYGDGAFNTVNARAMLGASLFRVGRWDDALPVLREALEQARVVAGPAAAPTLDFSGRLAELLAALGHAAEAEALATEALGLAQTVLAPDHPLRPALAMTLADAQLAQGRRHDAELLSARAIDDLARIRAPDPVGEARLRLRRAEILAANGCLDEALQQLDQVFFAQVQHLGALHPHTRETAALQQAWRGGLSQH